MGSFRNLFGIAAVLGAVSFCQAFPQPAGRGHALELPLFFESNQGQFPAEVRYVARGAGMGVSLTARGADLQFARAAGGQRAAVSVRFENASPAAQVTGLEQMASTSNYFRGSDRSQWRRGVAQYRRVRYDSLYPGIDLVWYSSNRQLEYDFVLHPGARPQDVRIRLRGAERLRIDSRGDLVIETAAGAVTQKKPVLYQVDAAGARRQVAGRYRMLGRNLVGFETASYDRARDLVIDPVLVYSSLVGAGAADAIVGVKVDSQGKIYVVGSTNSTDFKGTNNAYKGIDTGDFDVFVAKIDPAVPGISGLLYFTYIGGTGTDLPKAMDLDAAGNVYITGTTNSTDFPTAGSAQSTALSGGASWDAFVVKFSPSSAGSADLVYSSYLGGTALDQGNAISVDKDGAIYVTGFTQSSDFPLTSTAAANALWGSQDAFLAKINPGTSPSLVYSTYLGGEIEDTGWGVAAGSNGVVYMAGSTLSQTFPLAGNAYRPSPIGKSDIFVSAIDTNKTGRDSLIYSSYLGGTDLDEVRGLALDSHGRLLLTGFTMSNDFPVSANALQSELSGPANVFLARLDLTQTGASQLEYASYFGGSVGEVAYAVAADESDNVYLTGYTLSPDFPVTGEAVTSGYNSGIEVFATKFQLPATAAPALAYSTYIGNTGVNVGYGIAVASDGTVYIGGVISPDPVPAAGAAMQSGFGGGISDGFVVGLAMPSSAGVAGVTPQLERRAGPRCAYRSNCWWWQR